MANSKSERMRRLSEEIQKCRRCGLCGGRQNPVVGEGDLDAALMFVGEAPGRREDETGRPFVGAAGQRLNRLLHHIELDRENVYIGNVVKCRPPNNRRPRHEEIKVCSPHLEKQLEIIEPKIVAPMGNSSIGYFMRRFGLKSAPIGIIHGRQSLIDAPWGEVILFPLYHPAAAIYTRDLEQVMKKDFKVLGELLTRSNHSRY
jgi:uracil-DNA glycosylase family 4